MANVTGQVRTYNNTIPHKRVVTDRITMAEPMEFPLMKALGINASKFNFVNEPGKKYEWLQDTYSPLSTTANQASLTNDSTTTTIATADGKIFHVGDVIQIDDEYIWVSSISSNTLTVVRDHGGTQDTHLTTATIHIRSQARLEGANASDSPSTEVTSGYNFSFILHKNIEVSRTNALLKRYGIESAIDREIDKGMNELMRLLTIKPYYGSRNEGSATAGRDAGGFGTFITTNRTNMSSARLTRNAIDTMNRTIFDAGGVPKLLVCGAFNQQLISDMFEGYVTTLRSETMGGVIIKRLQMALGNVIDVLVDRYCPPAKVWMLDTDKVGFIPIDPFFFEELGKVGDTAAYGQIVGEYGFVVEVNAFHGEIYGCATS